MNRLLLCFAILTPWVAGWAGPVPFDPHRGLVEVEVEINGIVKGTFGIDTGADRLYIDRRFADKNHLKISDSSEKLHVAGMEGIAEASDLSLRSLRIGEGETLYNLDATAVDMNTLAGQCPEKHPDGLIGHEVLRRFYVTIDYPERIFELVSQEPQFLCDGRFVEVPFKQQRHLILVDVYFGEGVEAPMILDYCASLTTISPHLAEELDYDPNGPSRITIPNMSIGGVVESVDVPALIKDHCLLKASVPDANFEGILGASFLYRHEITVDYKRQKVYVHEKR